MSEKSTPPMGPSAGLRARRALGEIVIIVFGVLAALAVNAGWQKHVDQEREQHYLRQLGADVGENKRRLEEALALEQGQLQRASSILAALRNNPEARAVFRSFRMNTEARTWYLGQMLTATTDLLGRLQTDVAAGS